MNAPAAPAAPAASAAQGPGQYRRLLLIDDEPGIRKMMSLDLTADGYQVYTAEDGVKGLAVFKEHKPELVLTDIKMPGLSGIEVLKRIKRMSPDTEVIVITGHGDMELAIESLQLQASDFITKPINGRALEVALRRAAERLAMKDKLASYTESLEEKVVLATGQIVASERLAAVGQTVSSLVHSIKNMLSGLRGGTYMVKQGMTSDDQQISDSGIAMLERSMCRLRRLVSDLLTVSKPRTPCMVATNLQELALEAADCLALEASDHDVEVRVIPSQMILRCQTEQQAIMDVLGNLLSNAIDAAAQQSRGRVEIALGGNTDEVWAQVSDNGPGLDEEAVQNIFKGFYSTKGASGTGLGLMVAQKTASEHGGRVEFESRPGLGAMFKLVLPRTRAADTAEPDSNTPRLQDQEPGDQERRMVHD